jgi:predicted nucleotidyltransferase
MILIAMVDLIEDRKEDLARICPQFGVLSLALFGSATREDFHAETSDLNFVVEFAPMSPDEHARSYFGLLKELEHLFQRKVDLVEASAVRNPYIRRDIDRRGYRFMQRRQRAYLWDICNFSGLDSGICC